MEDNSASIVNISTVRKGAKKNNSNLGGEQSGHIILGNFATTGDGLLVALECLFALRKGKKASEFFDRFKKTPQILKNIQVTDKNIINKFEIKKCKCQYKCPN